MMLMLTWNDINVIAITPKLIRPEVYVLYVPEWYLTTNTHSFITWDLWLPPWWWVIYFQQSLNVLYWFWNVHHWNTGGLTTSVRQTSYLGQGGILSFRSVDFVLAFLSTPHRFCSFLLRVVGLAGWTSTVSSSAPQPCDEPDQAGLLRDGNVLRWLHWGLQKPKKPVVLHLIWDVKKHGSNLTSWNFQRY